MNVWTSRNKLLLMLFCAIECCVAEIHSTLDWVFYSANNNNNSAVTNSRLSSILAGQCFVLSGWGPWRGWLMECAMNRPQQHCQGSQLSHISAGQQRQDRMLRLSDEIWPIALGWVSVPYSRSKICSSGPRTSSHSGPALKMINDTGTPRAQPW